MWTWCYLQFFQDVHLPFTIVILSLNVFPYYTRPPPFIHSFIFIKKSKQVNKIRISFYCYYITLQILYTSLFYILSLSGFLSLPYDFKTTTFSDVKYTSSHYHKVSSETIQNFTHKIWDLVGDSFYRFSYRLFSYQLYFMNFNELYFVPKIPPYIYHIVYLLFILFQLNLSWYNY